MEHLKSSAQKRPSKAVIMTKRQYKRSLHQAEKHTAERIAEFNAKYGH